ncbi:hypothetical protein GCM10010269_22550 [Streptomyces humidus]|uniref:Uncharacterized protein n=1 Tax=Streptomyces humidus TaxID=52259 RepID=A0A918FUE6_9ACTN|nr:hypothetical protein GCM10010269_22550 [Streptomyces humidus]
MLFRNGHHKFPPFGLSPPPRQPLIKLHFHLRKHPGALLDLRGRVHRGMPDHPPRRDGGSPAGEENTPPHDGGRGAEIG